MSVYYPPPQPFTGGQQPLTPRTLTPPSVTSLSDTPPHALYAQYIYIIQRAWPPRDYGRPAGSSGSLGDNPPFGLLAGLWPILKQWEYIPPPPVLAPKLTPPSVTTPSDNPPFGWPPEYLINALKLWEPGPPRPYQTAGPLLQGVISTTDNPPPNSPDALVNILAAWQPARFIPMWGWVLVVDNTHTPDNPPFGYDPYVSIVRSTWDVGYRPFIPKTNLIQEFVTPLDNPPFGGPDSIIQANILRAWVIEPPAPWRRTLTAQVNPDNPPLGWPPAWLRQILESWQPGPPRPILTTGPLVQEGATPILGLPLWVYIVLATWNPPPDYRPFLRGPLQFLAAIPPPPPTDHGHKTEAQWIRRLRWLHLRQGR